MIPRPCLIDALRYRHEVTGLRESRGQRWGRRGLSIAAVALSTVLLCGITPLVVPLLVLGDLVRSSRLAATRAWLAFAAFLIGEVCGIVASAVLWLLRPLLGQARYVDGNYGLQRVWARSLLASATGLFSMRRRIEGVDVLQPGPFLLFVRHASIIDALLAACFVSHPHGFRLRYVLKSELLWDPCLDIVGQRLPNVFIRRGTGEGAREVEAIQSLAADLGRDEGVLIYPEGTRFTPAKQQSAMARIAAANPERHARVKGLRHTLPPRLGGPLGLIEARPDLDVVFLTHVGFEGVHSLGDLWRGALTGRELRVAFWRCAAAEIPRDRAAREVWLDTRWQEIDAWVDRQQADKVPSAPG